MKVAFLAMSNHIRITHSSDFFIETLRALFGDVTVILHERAWIEIPRTKWDLLIVYQKRYRPEELEAFGADRVVLVPMLDDCTLDESYWRRYKQFKVFCFSRTMEKALSSYGLQAWGVSYYPEAPQCSIIWSGLSGFFWPRSPAVDWPLVRNLIEGTTFERLHLHGAPPDEARDCPNIERSTWFESQEEYKACLARSNVFFAPRTAEGIGLSFIEAMAMGLCVVAPDRPTMNEYIEGGKNGLLYDPDKPQALDFSRAREMGAKARASCEEGRKAWLDAQSDILHFLEEPARGYSPKPHPFYAAKGKAIAHLRHVPGLFAFYRFLRSLVQR